MQFAMNAVLSAAPFARLPADGPEEVTLEYTFNGDKIQNAKSPIDF